MYESIHTDGQILYKQYPTPPTVKHTQEWNKQQKEYKQNLEITRNITLKLCAVKVKHSSKPLQISRTHPTKGPPPPPDIQQHITVYATSQNVE